MALTELDKLLRKYYPPLQAFLARSFHVSEEQAADWLQSFVWKKVMLKNLFAHADRTKGRFRTFLLNALGNFVRDEIEHASRQRRLPAGGVVPLDELTEQELPATQDAVSQGFDVAWARGLLAETLRRMEAECGQKGNQRVWEVFRLRLLEPMLEGAEPPPYKELLTRLGFQSDAEAGNALVTAKRMFLRLLRATIAEHANSEGEIDEEIRDLVAILGR